MRANYVLGLIGSLITLTLLFELMRRRRLREKYAVFWVVVALVTLVIAVFPATLTSAASLVGVQVPANLLFFGASMLLLGVSIHQSYELGRLEERTRTLAVASAAASVTPAAMVPSHRCHSSSGDPSISGARANRQPARVANNAKTAPARTLATATVRQRSSAVVIPATSANAAAMTSAIGK